MDSLTFAQLTEADVPELEEWHKDPEVAHRYGGSTVRKIWDITLKDPNRTLWLAKDGDLIVGYVDFEAHPADNLAWIGLIVRPALRRQGWGTRILREFLESDTVKPHKEIWAGIEHDNAASRRCFERVGFTPKTTEPDNEGILDYVFTRAS